MAALVYCANTSVGVTLLGQIVEQVAAQLTDDWDIEIVEAHHHHKVDAPSGTALALGKAAARGRGVELEAVADMVRKGQTGARKQGDIGFAVLRGGDVIGEHSVIFFGQSERVEISHKATDRVIFARGALRAARFAANTKPGFFMICRRAQQLGHGGTPVRAAQRDIFLVAANLDLCTVPDHFASLILADHHGGLAPAMANGADFAQIVGDSQKPGAAGKHISLKIGAQSIAHHRNVQLINNLCQLPDLIIGDKLRLIDKNAIDCYLFAMA